MLRSVVEWSVHNRLLVLALTAVLIGVGLTAARSLPVDAVPDITSVQVQVLTQSPALGPLEVERFVTIPIERGMGGIPGVRNIRSLSKFGLSQVTLVFEDGADIYRARQLVSERLQEVRSDVSEAYGRPELAPLSTGLGEVYQFELRGPEHSPMQLRSILEGYVIPQLRGVEGVVEVNSFGGELRTYQLELDPARLAAYRLSLRDVIEAIERGNGAAGGAYLDQGRQLLIVRGDGLIESLDDLAHTVIVTRDDGTPILARDLGRVRFAPAVRHGAVTRDGRGEIVAGVVMMLIGANSREVVGQVRARVAEIQPTLPEGVEIVPFYDRTELIERTVETVARNLAEGGALVLIVLFLFLRNLRAGLIVATLIPLSMLFALIGMRALGLSGNLMSLGAIDFGLLVDGAVIVIENAVRRLGERSEALDRPLTHAERDEVVLSASVEVRTATAFGELIIAIVYLPILTLEGIEGKMFVPMAMTVVLALAGAFVLSLTLVPALASLLLPLRAAEHEGRVFSRVRRRFTAALDRVLARRGLTVGLALALLLGTGALLATRGGEFIPQLDEGAIAMEVYRLPSTSLREATTQTTQLERALMAFPEVTTVVSKTGRSEIAMDPMGVEMSDVLVGLTPRDSWRFADGAALVEAMEERLRDAVPGIVFGFSQPIEMRMSEMIAGTRADVAIKLYGDDLEVLRDRSEAIARVLRQVPGAEDVRAEQITGLPTLRVRVDRRRAARYGVRVQDVLDTVAAVGGREVGTVQEGTLTYAIIVRIASESRDELAELARLPVRAGDELVPLGQVARLMRETGPAQLGREGLSRRVTIQANVRGRDLASFVAEAQTRLRDEVPLPERYRLTWGGQFEQLEAATHRLLVVIPGALLLILLLLYMSFGAVRPAVLVFINVPFAITGGVAALTLRGMPLSISAGVGFIALFGIAVLNGLVLVTSARRHERSGLNSLEAIRCAAIERLRPVLMTATVAALGFLPMALSSSAGAEVQRPLATVVLGGIISSTFLTLFVLPVVYSWFGGSRTSADSPAATSG